MITLETASGGTEFAAPSCHMAPRIAFIVEGRYLRQEMPRAVIRELAARGLEPEVLCPQGARFDPQSGIFSPDSSPPLDLNRSDVVVARCRDALGLAMLAYAETAHMLTINSRSATEQVRSKAEMAVALERGGVPSAPTVLASDVAVVAGLSEDWFPLLLKPTYGDNSQGLRLIRRRTRGPRSRPGGSLGGHAGGSRAPTREPSHRARGLIRGQLHCNAPWYSGPARWRAGCSVISCGSRVARCCSSRAGRTSSTPS